MEKTAKFRRSEEKGHVCGAPTGGTLGHGTPKCLGGTQDPQKGTQNMGPQNIKVQPGTHSLHRGINPPLQKHHPLFLAKAPL